MSALEYLDATGRELRLGSPERLVHDICTSEPS